MTDDDMQHAPRPWAPPDREESAKQVFAEWQAMSPQEWAARFSHGVLCSSFDDYRYRDEALGRWIAELHQIWRTPGALRACRERFLSPDEIKRVEDEENEF